MDACELNGVEFAESFDDVGLLLRHDEQRGQKQRGDNNDNDKKCEQKAHVLSLSFAKVRCIRCNAPFQRIRAEHGPDSHDRELGNACPRAGQTYRVGRIGQAAYAPAMAWSRSAIRSSTFSKPIDRRIRLSPTPAAS